MSSIIRRLAHKLPWLVSKPLTPVKVITGVILSSLLIGGLYLIPVQMAGTASHELSGRSAVSSNISPVLPVTTVSESDITWYAPDSNEPYLPAHAAIMMDNTTGTILYAKNPHAKRAPASTTKILTALIALEVGRLDDVVTVSREAASTRGSSAGLYTGQKIRMEHLIHGLLLQSGNDAAVAIAEHIAGSVQGFADIMNDRARQLGAVNSNFKNPHGLDEPDHYSSAYDLALLARFALHYPLFGEIIAKRTYSTEESTWTNTNELLWRFEGASGIKTGTTGQAGYCLVASASRDGMQLITVVLGAGNRYRETTTLLDYGYNEFRIVTLAQRGDLIARLPLFSGATPIEAVAMHPLRVLIKDQSVSHISTRFSLLPGLKLPIGTGQRIGELELIVGGEKVKSVPLMAGRSVRSPSIWGRIRTWFSSRTNDFEAG